LTASGDDIVTDKVDSTSDARTVNNVVRHEYRVLSDQEKADMKKIKDIGADLIAVFEHLKSRAPRELSLAITKAEEAVMWGVKGITK
jgi:hypothetical protein